MGPSISLGTTVAVLAIVAMLIIPVAILTAADDEDRDTLYQVSTLDAFLDAQYDGIVSYSDVFEMGDTGLGTFDTVNGEMIAFDGNYYQVLSDGSVVEVSGDETTPLCMVTWFDCDASLSVGACNLTEFKAALDGMRDSDNYIYVFVAHGTLTNVTTRSYPSLSEPYPPLTNVTASLFNAENVTGTLVIMWFPSTFSGLNLNDYHIHFMADDLSIGGHVTAIDVGELDIEMDLTSDFDLILPLTDDYRDWEQNSDNRDVE